MPFILLSISLVIILGANSLIISHDFYNTYWWLDLLLHSLGGMWLAGMWGALGGSRFTYRSLILWVLAGGLAWEALEYFINIPFFGENEASFQDSLWILDTLLDLVADVAGALLFWKLLSAYTKRNA